MMGMLQLVCFIETRVDKDGKQEMQETICSAWPSMLPPSAPTDKHSKSSAQPLLCLFIKNVLK